MLGEALDLVALLDVVGLSHATSISFARLQLRARALRLGEPCLPRSVAELGSDAEFVVDLVGHLHVVVLTSDGLVDGVDARDAEDLLAVGVRNIRLEVGLVDAKNASAFALARLSARCAVRQRLGLQKALAANPVRGKRVGRIPNPPTQRPFCF